MIFKLLDTEIPIIEYEYDTSDLEKMFEDLSESFEIPSMEHKLSLLDKRRIANIDNCEKNKTWNNFFEHFESRKKDLVKTFIEHDNKGRYPKNVIDNLSDSLVSYVLPTVDYPQFKMNYHLDTRLSFCQGFLNVVDNESLTSFKTSVNGKEIFRCSGEKNIGYFWLNTENSFHELSEVSKKRKIILFNILFVSF